MKIYIVILEEYSDPYEPPLTTIDAVFSSRGTAEAWVKYRNQHVDFLIERINDSSPYLALEEDAALGRLYGFRMGCPSSREVMGEPHEFFKIEAQEVRAHVIGNEYPREK
jgi:hypothetical protein